MSKGNRGGRPSKFTPKVCAAILDAVRHGAHLVTACGAVGISYDTLRSWRSQGVMDPAGKYGVFVEQLRRAEFEEEAAGLREIYEAAIGGQLLSRTVIQRPDGETTTVEKFATGDWRARAWMMSRRHPERWAAKHMIDIAGQAALGVPGGSFDSPEFAKHRQRVEAIKLLSPEDRAQLLRLRDKMRNLQRAMEADAPLEPDEDLAVVDLKRRTPLQ